MASRESRPRFRVQRLPLGLFGFNRVDVLELATRLEAEQQGATDAFAAVEADQRERIIRTLARRDALEDLLARLRLDRERLAHQLELARQNTSAIDVGVREEITRLEAMHKHERVRLEGFLPEVDRAIVVAEEELRRLAEGLERILRGAGDLAEDASTEFADVTAALLATPPEDMPVRRLSGGRTLFELPQHSVTLQVRGAAPAGSVTGVVVSGPPPRVLGFAVQTGEGDGVIPAGDVVALRQGIVLLRDKYRLLDVNEVPEESTRVIFPVARPSRGQAGDRETSRQVTEAALRAAAQTEMAAGVERYAAEGRHLADEPSGSAQSDELLPPATFGEDIVDAAGVEDALSLGDGSGRDLDVPAPVVPQGAGPSREPVPSEVAVASVAPDVQVGTESLPQPEERAEPGPECLPQAGLAGSGAEESGRPEVAETFAAPPVLEECSAPIPPATSDDSPEPSAAAEAPAFGRVEGEAAAPAPMAVPAAETAAGGPAAEGGADSPLPEPVLPEDVEPVAEAAVADGPADGAATVMPREEPEDTEASAREETDEALGDLGGGDLETFGPAPKSHHESPSADTSAIGAPAAGAEMSPAPHLAESAAPDGGRPAAYKETPVPEPDWPAGLPLPAWWMPGERVEDAPRPQTTVSEPEAPRPRPPAARPPQRQPQRPSAPPAEARVVAGGSGLNILAFISGKVVGRDLYDQDGRLVAAQGTHITPDLVAEVEAMGLLPEMIVYMTLPEGGQ